MVLVDRRSLLSRFSDSRVVQALAGYLLLGRAPQSDRAGSSERDRITIAAIRSIALNDRSTFEAAYHEIQRRQINAEADWIFDNYLLFALVTAGLKFSADLTFMQQALETRRVLQSGREAEVTDELLSLAKQHRIELPPPIVFVGEHLANAPTRDERALRGVYAAAMQLLAEWDDEFMNIICMAAADVVVTSSPLIPEVPALFWRECNRRITIIASGVHTLASVILIAAWAAAIVHYLTTDSKLLEKLFTAGLILFPAAFVWKRTLVVRKVRRIILRLIGGHHVTRQAIRINAA
jgi:hypothetical protein